MVVDARTEVCPALSDSPGFGAVSVAGSVMAPGKCVETRADATVRWFWKTGQIRTAVIFSQITVNKSWIGQLDHQTGPSQSPSRLRFTNVPIRDIMSVKSLGFHQMNHLGISQKSAYQRWVRRLREDDNATTHDAVDGDESEIPIS